MSYLHLKDTNIAAVNILTYSKNNISLTKKKTGLLLEPNIHRIYGVYLCSCIKTYVGYMVCNGVPMLNRNLSEMLGEEGMTSSSGFNYNPFVMHLC